MPFAYTVACGSLGMGASSMGVTWFCTSSWRAVRPWKGLALGNHSGSNIVCKIAKVANVCETHAIASTHSTEPAATWEFRK